MMGMSEESLEYVVLPDDPEESLNILREAAGLEPWTNDER